ncbi:MAG: outer membrane protein assembly factor [Alphaproteobacteria bacterium]|nr:outer membrane protein assembly factor [Alphaproteobacteria bacterium]
MLGLSPAAWNSAQGQTEGRENPPANEQPSEPDKFTYSVNIVGDLEKPLKDRLEKTSNLFALRDRPPQSRAGLTRRITRDKERLFELLRSEGFYNGEINAVVDETKTPVEVTLNIDTGIVYLLEQYELRYAATPAGDTALFPREPEDLGLALGMRARSSEIRQASRDLITRFGEIGRPLASITNRSFVVDHDKTTMRVVLDIDPGPRSVFGKLSMAQLDTVSPSYVSRLLTWNEGEIYDQRKVEAFRTRLVGTALFDSVAIDHTDTADPDGALPIELQVRERKHRSIGAGATISTDEGLAGNLFWEHRNLLGENEKFRVAARAGLIEQSLNADFIKPNFRTFDQNLLLNSVIRRQQDDAFDEKTFAVFAGLERGLFDNWRVRAGPSFDYSILNDATGERNVELIGFPMLAQRDDTDDLLDATRGTRLSVSVTPYFGAIEESVSFAKLEASGEAFLSLDTDSRFVLAARSRIGSIVGESTSTVPANKRFYAGGGGSVRGYPFRSLGPLDIENDPLGGRAVLELGFETRVRVSEDIGLVPFVEGGSVFDETISTSLGNMRWAAGLGLRYFTAIGPLRLDVATPLDKRPAVDDDFEIYLSIGQAF